jgi:DNA-binding CsgD family transcriptional regulator
MTSDQRTHLDRELRDAHADSHHRLSAALSSLSPTQREVVSLRWGHCHTHAQIAARMGITEGATMQHVSRIRRSLALALGYDVQPERTYPRRPRVEPVIQPLSQPCEVLLALARAAKGGALGTDPPKPSHYAALTPHETWLLWFMRREARLGFSGELVVRGRS